jgi:putative sigma-54 modulation protein
LISVQGRPAQRIPSSGTREASKEGSMRIEVKGRNVAVTDEFRARVEKRFEKIARQVSDLARMEVELSEERNPAIKDSQVAEATLYLKGVTLRASDRSTSMGHAINEVADDIARQVKRHREKRRGRREARATPPAPAAPEAPIAPPPTAS